MSSYYTNRVIKKGSKVVLFKNVMDYLGTGAPKYDDISIGEEYEISRVYEDGDVIMFELKGHDMSYEGCDFEDLDNVLGEVEIG